MKKILTLALTIAMVLTLAACGGSNKPDNTKPDQDKKEVTMTAQEVLDAMKKSLGDSYTSNEAETEDRISGFYGLDLSKIESWAGDTRTDSAMDLDTSLVLKVKDGYAETAAKSIQEALDQIASYSQMYNMDLFRVSEARIFISGNYVGYFIEGTPADWQETEENQAKQAASEAEKIDAAWEEIFGSSENIAVISASAESNGFVYEEESFDEEPVIGG